MKTIKAFVLVVCLCGLSTGQSGAQNSPCSQETFRDFDFWIGHWQVGNDSVVAGYSRVDLILDSCVLLENWTGTGPSRGKSFNHFDLTSGKWKQKWVDNFGTNLEFIGNVRNDSMIYETTSVSRRTGDSIRHRMIIAKIDQDHVKQHWAQSNDDGTTWTVAFDAIYSRSIDQQEASAQEEVQRVLDDMYTAISFNADKPFDEGQFREVFMSGATLVNATQESAAQDPIAFAAGLKELEQRQASFYERDGPVKIDVFGKVAQYRGYYVASEDKTEKTTISQGVNLAQLVRDTDGKWKIISIIWDEDKELHPFKTKF
ncbi:MAG: hypothetical protein KTR24_03885 [Saprospiraceae bacterium]|nr:hypothetical protein [Saprospiraceae bacterium]